MDPINGNVSGNTTSVRTSGNSASQGFTTTGITSFPSPTTNTGNLAIGATGGSQNSLESTNSSVISTLQNDSKNQGGLSKKRGSIYINSLTVNNSNVYPDKNKNLFDVSGEAFLKPSTTTILYIIGAFVIGFILGIIALELFEVIIIRMIRTKRDKENS
jgi:hypothetical protein